VHQEEVLNMSSQRANALFVLATGLLLGQADRTSAEPSITLTSPVGGEHWSAASQHFLTWKADQLRADIEVKITYSTDGGKKWVVVSGATPNSGRYLWRVPNAVSKHCLVRVTAGAARAENSSRFAITPSQEVNDYQWVKVTEK